VVKEAHEAAAHVTQTPVAGTPFEKAFLEVICRNGKVVSGSVRSWKCPLFENVFFSISSITRIIQTRREGEAIST
jgi:hypothetical protein